MISNQQPYNNHQHQPGPPNSNNSTSNMSPHQPSPRSAHHLRHLTSSHGNGSPGSRHNGRRVHDSRSAFFFALFCTSLDQGNFGEIRKKFRRFSQIFAGFCQILSKLFRGIEVYFYLFFLLSFSCFQTQTILLNLYASLSFSGCPEKASTGVIQAPHKVPW